MKVAITLFITCALLSSVFAQNYQFSADFSTSNPSMGQGLLSGRFTYSWSLQSYQAVYTNIQYTLLWQFNQWFGQNQALSDPYVSQWRFKQGPGCPGGCEAGRVLFPMPVLYWNTTQYSDDNFAETVGTQTCSRFSLQSSAPKSGVSKIWFSTKSASATVCKVLFDDGTFYQFSNVNTNPGFTATSFAAPSNCSCSNPIDIVLVLDRSGSISVNEWKQFYNFLQSFGKAFKWAPDKANLAIVNFNTVAFGATTGTAPPVLGLTGDSSAVVNTLASLACCNTQATGDQSCCDGWTSLAAGVRAGYDELAKSKRSQATKVLVLLTDGKANTLFGKSGNSCYNNCCNKNNVLPSGMSNSCPDGVIGPGIFPGAQYLVCIGDRNYDTIVDDWQASDSTRAANWPCTGSACSSRSGTSCCSTSTSNADFRNCNATGCVINSLYQPTDSNGDLPMKACHRDLIEAREYGFSKLGDKVITYAVGVGDVSKGELDILTNNRYKRPSGVNAGTLTTGTGSWTPRYSRTDITNPERVTTVDKWEQMAGILLELTAKICDEPAVQLSCGAGCCGTCFCAVCTPPDACAPSPDKCVDVVLSGFCCVNRTVNCPPRNCQNVVCNSATGCVYTPRPCSPAEDACYTYTCDGSTNLCNPTRKWSDPPNACYSSFCDTTGSSPVLVVNRLKNCSILDDACTTYSCQNSTGNCVPTARTPPPNANNCKFYTCDKVTGFQLNDKQCTSTPCFTTTCDPPTGQCQQTPITCNDPANLCDLTACDVTTGACPVTKIYKDCPNPTNKCVIGTAFCNTTDGQCVNPTQIKTCVQQNCHFWACDAVDGVCKPDSTDACDYCTQDCTSRDNKCFNYKCNTTTANLLQQPNCDVEIDLSKNCDIIFNTQLDSCVIGSTCDNTTGCQPVPRPPCPDPRNACFIMIRNSSFPGCCQELPKQNCDFGDKCFTYGCNTTTGECTAEPKCPTPSSPCFDRGCNSTTSECFVNPIECPAISCYDSKGCDETQGGCVKVRRSCDDMDACTFDTCDDDADKCSNKPIDCIPPDACTIATCDKVKGCVFTVRDCDDKIDCTRDWCDPVDGCKHEAQDSYCNDNNLCTNETCSLTEGCVYVNVTCTASSPCQVAICKPTFGCVSEQQICVLNSTGRAVFQENPDLNLTMSDEDKIKKKIEIANAQQKIDQDRKNKKKDCSYAVCSNSTCVLKKLACASDITVVAVASSLAAGAIAGIVIAVIVLLAGIGGGSAYIAQQAGGEALANVQVSPLYQGSGNSGVNPLAGSEI